MNIFDEHYKKVRPLKAAIPDFLPWISLPAGRQGRQACGIAHYLGFYTFLYRKKYDGWYDRNKFASLDFYFFYFLK